MPIYIYTENKNDPKFEQLINDQIPDSVVSVDPGELNSISIDCPATSKADLDEFLETQGFSFLHTATVNISGTHHWGSFTTANEPVPVVTGAISAVADASAAAIVISSVTDSGGVARFNFTPGPTLFVDQQVINSAFVINTDYNGTFDITAVGAGFFEIAGVAFGTDEVGSFDSNSVTMTANAHGRSEGTHVVISGTTSYNGNDIIYNSLTNSFQVNAIFVATETGTWSAGVVGIGDTGFNTDLNSPVYYDGSVWRIYTENITESLLFLDESTQSTAATSNDFGWHINAAKLVTSGNITAQDTSPQGMYIRGDGKKLLNVGVTNGNVYEYSMDPPWDLSTLSFLGSQSISAEDTIPRGVWMHPDGDTLFMVGQQNNSIYEYSLTSNGTILGGIAFVQSSVLPSVTTVEDLHMQDNGYSFFVTDSNNESVQQIIMPTVWDISSLVASSEETMSATISPRGLSFRPDGNRLIVAGVAPDSIAEFNVDTPWFVTGADVVRSEALGFTPNSLFIRPNGGNIYYLDTVNQDIYQYKMGIGEELFSPHTIHEDSAETGALAGLTIQNEGAGGVSVIHHDAAGSVFSSGVDAADGMYKLVRNIDLASSANKIFEVDSGRNIIKASGLYNLSLLFNYDPTVVSTLYTQYIGTYISYRGPVNIELKHVAFGIGSTSFFRVTRSRGEAPIVQIQNNGDARQVYGIYYRIIDDDIFELFFKNNTTVSATIAETAIVTYNDAIIVIPPAANDTGIVLAAVALLTEQSGNVVVGAEISKAIGNQISFVGNDVYEIFTAADLDALASGGVITVSVPTTIIYKGSITSNVTYVNNGTRLRILQEATGTQYVYTGAGTLFSGTGTVQIDRPLFISVVPGATFMDHTLIGNEFFFMSNVAIVGFSFSGTIIGGFSFSLNNVQVVNWGDPFNVINNRFFSAVDIQSISAVSGEPLFNVTQPNKVSGRIRVNTIGVNGAGSSAIRIDPDYVGTASIQEVIPRDSNFVFDTTGSTGTFTVVADAAVPAEAITSVTDSSGIARFNFAAPPTLFVGQEVIISTFVTNTTYNGTFTITATGANYFEVADIAFGTDETGSFLSNSVTLTDTGTTLVDGDTLVISSDNTVLYDGGATVYNQLTNSFQINRTFDITVTGTWDTSGLDETDPRVYAVNNTDAQPSQTKIELSLEGNVLVTPIPIAGAKVLINSTGWVSNSAERMKLTDPDEVTYTGLQPQSLKLDGNVLLEPDASTKLLSCQFVRQDALRVVVTFDNTTNIILETGHALIDGDNLSFHDTLGTLPVELRDDIIYYVVNAGVNDFQVAYTLGGAAVAFTDDGSGTNTYAMCDLHGSIPKEPIAANNARTLVPQALEDVETGDKTFLVVTNEDDTTDILVVDAYYRVVV